jgi:hypothetical protein
MYGEAMRMYCHAVDDGVSSVRGAPLAPGALKAPAMSAETDAPIAPSIDSPAGEAFITTVGEQRC